MNADRSTAREESFLRQTRKSLADMLWRLRQYSHTINAWQLRDYRKWFCCRSLVVFSNACFIETILNQENRYDRARHLAAAITTNWTTVIILQLPV